MTPALPKPDQPSRPTEPHRPSQTHRATPIELDRPSQTDGARPTKPDRPSRSDRARPTKPNRPSQTDRDRPWNFPLEFGSFSQKVWNLTFLQENLSGTVVSKYNPLHWFEFYTTWITVSHPYGGKFLLNYRIWYTHSTPYLQSTSHDMEHRISTFES